VLVVAQHSGDAFSDLFSGSGRLAHHRQILDVLFALFRDKGLVDFGE
jgi:acid stress-induced BolA-like protein IbaG/YrbA